MAASKIGYVYQIIRADGLDEGNRYIGSTLNFDRRKKEHAYDCNRGIKKRFYDHIRENGGWENFIMSVLEEVEITGKYTLTARESHWVEQLKARLNMKSPPLTPTVCEHGKKGTRCIECNGSGICEHKKEKRMCVECGGSQICEHNRRRNQCVECGGSQICEHKTRKDRCVECGGSGICEHKTRKDRCRECDPENYAKMRDRQNELARIAYRKKKLEKASKQ